MSWHLRLGGKRCVTREGCFELKLLGVSGTDFSDAGPEFLRGLKQLSVLFLTASRVRPEGALERNKVLPDVNVKFGL